MSYGASQVFFWVYIILCSPDNVCEHHKALKPGHPLPMNCMMQGQELARRYSREDLKVVRIWCGRDTVIDATDKEDYPQGR